MRRAGRIALVVAVVAVAVVVVASVILLVVFGVGEGGRSP